MLSSAPNRRMSRRAARPPGVSTRVRTVATNPSAVAISSPLNGGTARHDAAEQEHDGKSCRRSQCRGQKRAIKIRGSHWSRATDVPEQERSLDQDVAAGIHRRDSDRAPGEAGHDRTDRDRGTKKSPAKHVPPSLLGDEQPSGRICGWLNQCRDTKPGENGGGAPHPGPRTSRITQSEVAISSATLGMVMSAIFSSTRR